MTLILALFVVSFTRAASRCYEVDKKNLEDHSGASGSWLRHCATSRKVAGSIPDEVILFLN
jgi:hypothetical protein